MGITYGLRLFIGIEVLFLRDEEQYIYLFYFWRYTSVLLSTFVNP